MNSFISQIIANSRSDSLYGIMLLEGLKELLSLQGFDDIMKSSIFNSKENNDNSVVNTLLSHKREQALSNPNMQDSSIIKRSNLDSQMFSASEITKPEDYSNSTKLGLKESSASDLNQETRESLQFKVSKISKGNPINLIVSKLTNCDKEEKINILTNSLIEINDKSELEIKNKEESQGIFRVRRFIEHHTIDKKKECCSCKFSHCLKRYCNCFKVGEYCSGCSCVECLNTKTYENLRKTSINYLSTKNKMPSEVKYQLNPKGDKISLVGCKCKNSECKKNYCDCFRLDMKCSTKCSCISCKND